MGWFGRKKKEEIDSTHTIEAYIITPKGMKRLSDTTNPPLTYESCQILAALRGNRCTIGELADVCSHIPGSAIRKHLNELLAHSLIARDDKTIEIQRYR